MESKTVGVIASAVALAGVALCGYALLSSPTKEDKKKKAAAKKTKKAKKGEKKQSASVTGSAVREAKKTAIAQAAEEFAERPQKVTPPDFPEESQLVQILVHFMQGAQQGQINPQLVAQIQEWALEVNPQDLDSSTRFMLTQSYMMGTALMANVMSRGGAQSAVVKRLEAQTKAAAPHLWELLDFELPSEPETVVPVLNMKLEFAQNMGSKTKLLETFEALAEFATEDNPEAQVSLFTCAPVLARWDDFKNLSQQFDNAIIERLHSMAQMTDGLPDYQSLLQLVQGAEFDTADFTDLDFHTYTIQGFRYSFKEGSHEDPEEEEQLKKSMSDLGHKDDDETWSKWPLVQKLVRRGAICSFSSLDMGISDVRVKVVGPMSDTRIVAHGFNEVKKSGFSQVDDFDLSKKSEENGVEIWEGVHTVTTKPIDDSGVQKATLVWNIQIKMSKE